MACCFSLDLLAKASSSADVAGAEMEPERLSNRVRITLMRTRVPSLLIGMESERDTSDSILWIAVL